MRLEAINIGVASELQHNSKSLLTGIDKRPSNGDVFIGVDGVKGDAVVDQKHHGGPDQAVYAYSADDYDWWSTTTGVPFSPGQFGENLTIRGLASDLYVGDRLLLGEVVLEATAPRIPCSTLAMRMQDSGFGVTFRDAQRPGIYFRVLNEGRVSAGAGITYVASDESDVSILDLFRFNYATRHQADDLRALLEAPIAVRMREKVLSRLNAIQSDG